MFNAAKANDYASFVLRINEVVSTGRIIKSLYDISVIEWERSFNAETSEHLIKGVFTSPQKSDAVKVYITKVMQAHMNSLGGRLSAWTKETIGGENATNVAISNRIAATEFNSNEELFKLIATRLIGYDTSLIEFGITDESLVDERVSLLMEYVSGQFDLGDPERTIKSVYSDAFDILVKAFNEGSYTPEYVRKHINQSVPCFTNEKEIFNNWDVFVEVALALEEPDELVIPDTEL